MGSDLPDFREVEHGAGVRVEESVQRNYLIRVQNGRQGAPASA